MVAAATAGNNEMTKKLNLHWGLGQFEDFTLFGSVSEMQQKIQRCQFCIDYIENNYARITKNDEEEIQIYKRLIAVYKRRIKSAI